MHSLISESSLLQAVNECIQFSPFTELSWSVKISLVLIYASLKQFHSCVTSPWFTWVHVPYTLHSNIIRANSYSAASHSIIHEKIENVVQFTLAESLDVRVTCSIFKYSVFVFSSSSSDILVKFYQVYLYRITSSWLPVAGFGAWWTPTAGSHNLIILSTYLK